LHAFQNLSISEKELHNKGHRDILNVTKGMILTDDQEWEKEVEGFKIHVLPVWIF